MAFAYKPLRVQCPSDCSSHNYGHHACNWIKICSDFPSLIPNTAQYKDPSLVLYICSVQCVCSSRRIILFQKALPCFKLVCVMYLYIFPQHAGLTAAPILKKPITCTQWSLNIELYSWQFYLLRPSTKLYFISVSTAYTVALARLLVPLVESQMKNWIFKTY